MLMVQVKVSKKGGITVISASGEMHPCLDPEDLWEVMTELAAKPSTGTHTPVPDTLMLQVKAARGRIILIDPLAEMHPCADAHDLWDAVADLIESKEMPASTTTALATRSASTMAPHEHEPPVCRVRQEEPPQERMRPEEVRGVIEAMVGDAAAKLGSGLVQKLQGLSYRKARPKAGGKPRRRIRRGEIW